MNLNKLIEGVFLSHLEVLQWCHHTVHQICPTALHTYQAYQRRVQVQLVTDSTSNKNTISDGNRVPPPVPTTMVSNLNLMPTTTMQPVRYILHLKMKGSTFKIL